MTYLELAIFTYALSHFGTQRIHSSNPERLAQMVPIPAVIRSQYPWETYLFGLLKEMAEEKSSSFGFRIGEFFGSGALAVPQS